MANPNPSSTEPLSSTVHDAANRFAQQVNKPEAQEKVDQIREAAQGASSAINDFLDDASTWLKGNGGTTAAVVAAAAAVGLIGYYIGRNSRPELGDIQDL